MPPGASLIALALAGLISDDNSVITAPKTARHAADGGRKRQQQSLALAVMHTLRKRIAIHEAVAQVFRQRLNDADLYGKP